MPITIVRASTTSAGAQISSTSSTTPAISADGSKVVFGSAATNLVTGDVNGQADVFVKTLSTGAISLVSTSSAGAQQDRGMSSPLAAFTPDGTRVVFTSAATNLTAGDTNNVSDIFIKTLSTGAISRVSESAAGDNAFDVSSIRAGGVSNNFVAFESSASNLVGGDVNLSKDIFVKDLTTGAVVMASVSAAGDIGENSSSQASISADGTKVAFVSFANNLGADANDTADVFVKNLTSGAVTLVSTAADGTVADGGSTESMISADGTKVVFTSTASNFVVGDTNGAGDVFVKTLATGAIQRISVSNLGVQGDGASLNPSFSPDGTKVSFRSASTNLVTDDANGQLDNFVYDLTAGTLTRIVNAGGVEPDGAAGVPTMGPGGSVVFSSSAANLVTGDTNGVLDIFVATIAAAPVVVTEPEPAPEPPRAVSTGGNDAGVLPAGNNVFKAEAGDDTIGAGDGADNIQGNRGDDSLSGGGGTDSLFGGQGGDTVSGGEGADSLSGDLGNDSVQGGAGTDSVFGGDGADSVTGGEGADSIGGNQGSDSVSGDAGNDTLFGGQGGDTVYGGDGDDKLSGDFGDDILSGGVGADRFQFARGGGRDWAIDVNYAQGDRIQLAPGTAYTATILANGDVLIDLGNGDVMGLSGAASSFNSDWIVFG